jgi:hypothetical protein
MVSAMQRGGQRRGGGSDLTDQIAPQYPIESVDKALKLVLLLAEQPEIRLSEATRYLGVASSTVPVHYTRGSSVGRRIVKFTTRDDSRHHRDCTTSGQTVSSAKS